MSEHIRAPFTAEQAAALNGFQQAGNMHPFTCARGHLSGHVSLVAVAEAGWICPVDTCDYTQDWAHDFMLVPDVGKVVLR